MLHDAQSGYLRLKDRMDLINKIETLSNTPVQDVPEESRFLLDIDTNHLAEGNLDTQDYWVHAMEAATAALVRHNLVAECNGTGGIHLVCRYKVSLNHTVLLN